MVVDSVCFCVPVCECVCVPLCVCVLVCVCVCLHDNSRSGFYRLSYKQSVFALFKMLIAGFLRLTVVLLFTDARLNDMTALTVGVQQNRLTLIQWCHQKSFGQN